MVSPRKIKASFKSSLNSTGKCMIPPNDSMHSDSMSQSKLQVDWDVLE